MLGDGLREVMGQGKQIHQSCCHPGRSVMNNLSRMTDVLDVWFPGITAVTEACHDAGVAEGQKHDLKDEQGFQTGCFPSTVLYSPVTETLLSFQSTATLAARCSRPWAEQNVDVDSVMSRFGFQSGKV